MQVTNRSTAPQAFNLKDGETAILEPGESRNIALADPDSAQNKGRLHAGVVVFGKVDREEVARETARAAVPSAADKKD